MKMKYVVVFLALSSNSNAVQDRMIDTIRRVDPDNLKKLLIPGYFLREEQKQKYLAKAQEMTNKTFSELNSISFSDFIRLVGGSIKLGLGAICAASLYSFHKGYSDISLWSGFEREENGSYKKDAQGDFIRKPLTLDASFQKPVRLGTYGVLSCLSLYLIRKGIEDYSDIATKKNRLLRHRDALAVEAVIQRLPVCQSNGECEGSLLG